MPCGITNPLSCVTQTIGSGVGDLAASAWNAICQSFATAASDLLNAFAKAFVALPPTDFASPGIKNVYSISLGVAGVIAVLLLFGQVVRTAVTHDGSALAAGLTGIGKAAVAFMLTLVIATAASTAADDLTRYIVTQSFGSAAALTSKISTLISFSSLGNPGTLAGQASTLLLLLAVVGILLTMVLWFEMLLRNAAIAILVATSPIAASGQASDATRSWWPRMAAATVQLIALKPAVALVFAIGFSMTGKAQDIETLLEGMLVLLLAVFAWPVIARFFTFASVQAGGSAGLGVLLGYAAGRFSGGGASPGGVEPGRFSQVSEARVMASAGSGAAGAGGAAAGSAVGGAGGAGAGAAATVPAALIAAGIQVTQRAVTTLSGHMDQVAGHAGIGGSPQHASSPGADSVARLARSGAADSPESQPAPSPQPVAPPQPDWPPPDDPLMTGEFPRDDLEDGSR